MHLLNVQALLVFSKKPTVKFRKDKSYRDYAEVTDGIWFFFDLETKDIQKWDYRLKIIKRLRSLRKKHGI